ncbi:MAG: hypothetical protein KKD25_18990 [Gammaproteobacteria bacterium]|nr:hypothetical protein [Gammaproteobacteria bacterium]MBU0769923.1 hypothetical protein [Gammaproteobacteria bacterium]MBU0856272.1 hypothetical protein [Gammaproteobacteria bacterium]MBU1847775.1 hypothetical protein [Gammaproteobacteria bacterium]
MNLFTGESSAEFFGGAVPQSVRRLLDEAVGAPAPQVESLLWTAHACAPECLPVYYLLYKFHASRRQFDRAEQAARKGIAIAAQQAALDADWSKVQPQHGDFAATGPARFWLFSLKALAFICLRSGRPDEARALVEHIARLDATHGLGGDVIASLLDGSVPKG